MLTHYSLNVLLRKQSTDQKRVNLICTRPSNGYHCQHLKNLNLENPTPPPNVLHKTTLQSIVSIKITLNCRKINTWTSFIHNLQNTDLIQKSNNTRWALYLCYVSTRKHKYITSFIQNDNNYLFGTSLYFPLAPVVTNFNSFLEFVLQNQDKSYRLFPIKNI